MRAWLVGTSLVLHLSLIFGLFVAGAWRLEQLDPGKHHVDVWLPMPPPPAASGSPAPKAQPLTPKHRHIVHELVAPVPRVAEVPAADNVVATATGTGTGEGSGSGDDPTGTGPCTENCGQGSDEPPKVHDDKKPEQTTIPPGVLRGMRISGDTQIQASDVVKVQMMRDGKDKVSAMFKVCVDTAGGVSSLSRLRATGYPSYDEQLEAAIRTWRYHPYSVGGVAIPVCGVVTFNYDMK